MESGGRYDAVGPTHPKLGRALGKYQVMEANVGPWTKEVLGRELTGDQFLASQEAQDAVFQTKFGQNVAKHGPADAFSIWHSGRPLAQAQGARDSLGTRTTDYVQRGMAALGHKATQPVAREAGTQQVQVASAADADVPARGATETGGFNVPGGRGTVAGGSEIGPERLQMLREGLQSRNPAIQQMAIQEINRIRAEQAKGPDLESVAPGSTLYDKRTGRAIYTAPKDGAGEKWEFKELKDGRQVLFNPRTGETKAPEGQGPAQAPKPNFEVEDKLRDDYEKKLKPFEELQDAYGSVRAAVQGRIEAPDVQSPASDMALIFAYMKMLDPTSVVREGEYDKVGNTTNIPGKVLNYLNKARTGEMLNDDQIEDIVKSAHRRYEQKYKDTEKVADRFRQLAPHYGIDDPNRIVFLPERAEMPQVPKRKGILGGAPQTNQYGVVPTTRAWTNPDGTPPNVIKRGAYTIRQLD
jgi:hypothetical protein